MVSLAIGVAGPGSASIDSAIGIAENLDGWVGAAIIAAGFVVAALQLATFWRKPDMEGSSP